MLYKTIRNIIIIFIITFFFVSCSSKNGLRDSYNKTIKIGNKENPIVLTFDRSILKWHSFFCANSSYTILDKNIKYGNLFIEFISLDSNCHWRGLPLSFFESNLKSQLKFDSMQTVEEIEINSYVFKTYKINSNKYISIIYTYSPYNENRFIIDYKGLLYTNLIKSFDSNYINKFLNKNRYSGNYDDSLVRKNIINHYFYKESL